MNRSGIPYFDELTRDVEGELNFVNFEIMNKGLLLRSNTNQRQLCIGILFSDLRSINLLKMGSHPKDLTASNLMILTNRGVQMDFEVLSSYTKSLGKFFSKRVFRDLVHVAVKRL